MASLESVNVLTSTGMTVSREIRLRPKVMKMTSIRLTLKFQVTFF